VTDVIVERRSIAAIAAGMLLAGCGLMPQVEPVRPGPGGDEDIQPIGPVVEIGQGHGPTNGPWRYEIYESRIGTCTRISFDERGGEGPLGCGGTLAFEPPGAAISLMSYGSSSDSGWSIEGMASDEVAEVWVELRNAAHVPAAPLMPLEPVDLPGKLFYVEGGIDQVPVRVVALGSDGAILGEASIEP
jgi:hypothetical protein